jgi:hypothetical protein
MEGIRKTRRPCKRRIDEVEKGLKIMRVKDWYTVVRDRKE